MNFFHKNSKPAERHTHFYELWDAMGEGDCPICYLGRKEGMRYLDNVLHESVTNGGMQSRVAHSHGFGPRALEVLQKTNDNLGLGILYRRVCLDLLEDLKRHKLPPLPDNCPYEEHRNAAEKEHVQEFATHVSERDFLERYATSFGLCLRHLREVVGKIRDGATRAQLLEIDGKRVETIRKELDEMISKYNYRNVKPVGKEATVWRRAGIKTSDHALCVA